MIALTAIIAKRAREERRREARTMIEPKSEIKRRLNLLPNPMQERSIFFDDYLRWLRKRGDNEQSDD
jgi:hypothetical protein